MKASRVRCFPSVLRLQDLVPRSFRLRMTMAASSGRRGRHAVEAILKTALNHGSGPNVVACAGDLILALGEDVVAILVLLARIMIGEIAFPGVELVLLHGLTPI